MKEYLYRKLSLVDFSPSQCGHLLSKNALDQARLMRINEEEVVLNALDAIIENGVIGEEEATQIVDSCEKYPDDILEAIYTNAIDHRKKS
jgi:hypothetical protein